MNNLTKDQRYFLNFAEVINFLTAINSDIDTTKMGPDFSVFSKTKGIISGYNLVHLCNEIRRVFGIELVAQGCIQYPNGYLLTFEKGYLDEVEKKQGLESKTKAELLAMAKEKELDVSAAMKKEDILTAILSS